MEDFDHRTEKLQQEIAEAATQMEKFQSRMERLSRQHEIGLLSDDQLKERAATVLPDLNLFLERVDDLKNSLNNPKPPPSLAELKVTLAEVSALIEDSDNDAVKAKLADKFELSVTVSPEEPPRFRLKIFASIPLASPESEVFTHWALPHPIVSQSSR
jgi:chromosome segregation ATPase